MKRVNKVASNKLKLDPEGAKTFEKYIKDFTKQQISNSPRHEYVKMIHKKVSDLISEKARQVEDGDVLSD